MRACVMRTCTARSGSAREPAIGKQQLGVGWEVDGEVPLPPAYGRDDVCASPRRLRLPVLPIRSARPRGEESVSAPSRTEGESVPGIVGGGGSEVSYSGIVDYRRDSHPLQTRPLATGWQHRTPWL